MHTSVQIINDLIWCYRVCGKYVIFKRGILYIIHQCFNVQHGGWVNSGNLYNL